MYRDETKNLVNFPKNVNWELFGNGIIKCFNIMLFSSSISQNGNNCEILDDTILKAISNTHSLYYIINFSFTSGVPSSGGTNSYYSIDLPTTLIINNILYRPIIISGMYDANSITSDTGYNQVLYPDFGSMGTTINFRTLSGQRINLNSYVLSGMQFTAIFYISNFSDALI